MAKQVFKKADSVSNRRQFGEHLKVVRKSKKLSLRDMADMCSLDNSNISKIEKGKLNITLTTIIELAKGLGVHPKELLDYDFN
jgi:transcriptional regulator with XRE-family HTH domain